MALKMRGSCREDLIASYFLSELGKEGKGKDWIRSYTVGKGYHATLRGLNWFDRTGRGLNRFDRTERGLNRCDRTGRGD